MAATAPRAACAGPSWPAPPRRSSLQGRRRSRKRRTGPGMDSSRPFGPRRVPPQLLFRAVRQIVLKMRPMRKPDLRFHHHRRRKGVVVPRAWLAFEDAHLAEVTNHLVALIESDAGQKARPV